jgi:hypothetical protein
MFDQIFDRNYQSGRFGLNSDLGRVFDRVSRTVNTTFCSLARIQFDAPWAKRPRDAHCG